MSVVGQWLVIAGALGQTVFVLLYGFGTNWTRDAVGRALMVKGTGLALSLDVIAAFYIFGDYPHRADISLLVFAMVVAGIYWQLLVFVKMRYVARKARGEARG